MKLYYRYWGKTERNGKRYHLLPYHCLDVAAVGWLLLNPDKPLCRQLARQLNIEPELLQRLVAFFLCQHDIGKFSVAFQGLVPGLSPMLVRPNNRKPYTVRHDSLGYGLWCEEDGLSCRFESEDYLALFANSSNAHQLCSSLDHWMEIVTGHHGIPPKNSFLNLKNFFDEQDKEAAYHYLQAISGLFIRTNDLKILAEKSFFNRLKTTSWTLAGLVVLADWLGSSRHPDLFFQNEIPLEEYWQHHALPFAGNAVEDAKLEPAVLAPYVSTRHLFDFINILTPLQQWAEGVELASGPQLFIFEDVTGAGKTEAATSLAHRLMASDLANGLYVALPTMATANAMYERLGNAYRRLYANNALPSLVLAHGARHLSKAFRTSLALPVNPDAQRRYVRDEETVETFCTAWLADSCKKALLAEVGVGTLDQALMAVLPARHQSLRCLGLARKLLIVDEVHAYDPYMNQLLQALLEYHASQGGSAILLSATLPLTMRNHYLQAFAKGAGKEAPALMEREEYPLATHFPAPGAVETPLRTRPEVARTVTVVLLDKTEEVMDLIKGAVVQGGCVCWVRNTVGDAIKSYRMLEKLEWLDEANLSLFHSRFAMIDRQRIEGETLSLFGKESTEQMRRGRVLIATQVVEQSLDLDFDMMISDLAPIDLLIQRMGREHRHIRDAAGNRVAKDGAKDQRLAPVFYIFGPPATETPEEHWLKTALPGTQAVYRNVGQLWLTQRLLGNAGKLRMPDDARHLIEGVYGEEEQERIPEPLQLLANNAIADAYAKSGVAKMNTLKLSKGYTKASAEDSGGWDEETRIPTRLGDDTVRLALVVADGEGWRPYAEDDNYAWDLSMLSVPRHSWHKAEAAIPTTIQLSLETLKEEIKVLKWVNLFPLTPDLLAWYSKLTGWGIQEEGADESD